MKKWTTPIIALIVGLCAFTSANNKLLYKMKKTVNSFSVGSTQTIYAKMSKGERSSSMTPRIELAAMKHKGVTLREDFQMQRFDENLNKQWDIELKQMYKLFDIPYSITTGNENTTYFVEVKTNPFKTTKFAVQKIDNSGKLTSKELESDEQFDKNNHFILGDELNFLDAQIDKKNDIINYSIYYVDNNMNLQHKKIDLPQNEYEHSKRTGFGEDKDQYIWHYLGDLDASALFVKCYFEEIESNKSHRLILETIELDKNHNISNHKQWNFDPYLVDEDRKFVVPSLDFDETHKALYVFGYVSVDSKKLNGLYLLKYDYGTQQRTYHHEYSLESLMEGKTTSEKVHYEIPVGVDQVIPLKITPVDYLLDTKNEVLTINVITNYKGFMGKWESSYLEVEFDKYGDHISTALTNYNTLYYKYHNGVVSVPVYHEKIYEDYSRDHLANYSPSVMKLVDKYLTDAFVDEKYVLRVQREDHSVYVVYDEKEGTFNGTRIDR